MQYALLAYGSTSNQELARPIDDALAAILAGPSVTGWVRLHADESATTVRNGESRALLTDGPFIESKEFLGGLILVEAANLDEALALAQQMQETRTGGAIEVRPVREWMFSDA